MAKGDQLYYRALKIAQENDNNLFEVYNLLMRSFDLGNHKAAYALANWYLNGKFVKKNFKKAVNYLEYAANNNYAIACYDLAVSYEEGKGVKKDLSIAFELYLKAFLLGDDKSIYEVGRCYYYGLGIHKDIKLATIWLNIAEQKGFD